jgi:hypothetical protein
MNLKNKVEFLCKGPPRIVKMTGEGVDCISVAVFVDDTAL